MARFNTYSQLVSSANNSSADDYEENEEAEEVIDEDREDLDDVPTADATKADEREDEGQDDEDFNVENIAKAHNKKAPVALEEPRVELEVPKSEPLVQEYTDNNYWKGTVAMSDLDDLLADYE